MKSSIRVSRGGRSITFRGGAARAAFEGMTGTKLPPPEAPAAKARLCRVCGQQWLPEGSNTLCPVCESTDTIKL